MAMNAMTSIDEQIAIAAAGLRLEGVRKAYDTAVALDNVTIDIPAGAFTVLLGPSGCGKSTLLRLIAGLDRPTSGKILLGDNDITRKPPAERDLSMVFQSYALFPHLTVAQNITFGLTVRRVPGTERRAALARAVALTGLEGLESRKPSALSGGQRQRVALARAIVAGHPICLMDEPLSNLDAKLRHAVRQEIRALQRELGMTVLYVTHDQTEAMGMADRIVLMKDGKIEQQDMPEELYERPVSAFAAGFVGSPPMALLPAERLPVGLREGAASGGAGVLVGVRPEEIRLAGRDEPSLPVQVTGIEFLGGETLVYCAAEAGVLIAKLPGRPALVRGGRADITWNAASRHLFDAADGRRLSDPLAPDSLALGGRAEQRASGTGKVPLAHRTLAGADHP